MGGAMKGVLGSIKKTRTFASYEESERLEQRLSDLRSSGLIEEIPVTTPEHPLLEEHWYRDIETGEVYRYCPPEFPSRGLWEKVL
jgi:hypothetical protein